MKTSKKDFELFESECLRWIDEFGLKDWEVNFYHDGVEGGNPAAVGTALPGRRADFYLNPKWDEKPTAIRLSRTALHEVCHVLLAPLELCATSRYVNPTEVDMAEHGIIRALENALLPRPPTRNSKE